MAKNDTAAEAKAVEAKAEEKAAEVKAEVKAPKAEKKPAAKRAPRKAAAPKKVAEPVVYVQFAGAEVDVANLAEAAKAAFKAEKPRTAVSDLKLYVKPEEAAAYYVVNGEFKGKVSF